MGHRGTPSMSKNTLEVTSAEAAFAWGLARRLKGTGQRNFCQRASGARNVRNGFARYQDRMSYERSLRRAAAGGALFREGRSGRISGPAKLTSQTAGGQSQPAACSANAAASAHRADLRPLRWNSGLLWVVALLLERLIQTCVIKALKSDGFRSHRRHLMQYIVQASIGELCERFSCL